MANKILLLVEGERKDVALMERMFEVYLPDKKGVFQKQPFDV